MKKYITSNCKPPTYFIVLMVSTFLLITIILDCSRKESSSENGNSKYVLSQDDFFIKGLYYFADSATVIRVIGLPDSIKPIKQSDRFSKIGFSIWYYPDFRLFINPLKTLDGIEVKHSGFLTARGLGVDDSLNRVRELYGRSVHDYGLSYAGFYYCYNEDDTTGIHIQIDDSVITSIYVGHFFH